MSTVSAGRLSNHGDLMTFDDLTEGMHRAHASQSGGRIGLDANIGPLDKDRDHSKTIGIHQMFDRLFARRSMRIMRAREGVTGRKAARPSTDRWMARCLAVCTLPDDPLVGIAAWVRIGYGFADDTCVNSMLDHAAMLVRAG